MDLLDFIRQPLETIPSTPVHHSPNPISESWPIVIVFPSDPWIAVPENWRRLEDGRIETTYQSYQELYWSMIISCWLKEWVQESKTMTQLEMFSKEAKSAACNT